MPQHNAKGKLIRDARLVPDPAKRDRPREGFEARARGGSELRAAKLRD